MKRNPKLLSKRIECAANFVKLKRNSGISNKRAIIEVSQALSISSRTLQGYILQNNRASTQIAP